MKKFKPYDVLKNKKINYPELSNEVKYEVSILGGLDIFTDAHVRGVTDITTKICEELNMDYTRLKHMVVGAYLHDVGKIMIPNEVLQKNGRLTDEEYNIIKTHTTHGYDICMKYKELRQYAPIARWHHESFDGSGYPDGLKGEEIPIEVSLVKVADVYDALTRKRQYKDGYAQSKTLDIMIDDVKNNRMCAQFLYYLVSYLLRELDEKIKEQNKIIESYKETIKQLKNERDAALIKNKANEEKLMALQNIQNLKKKISEKYDYYPFKDDYKEDLDNFLNTIQKDELNINNQEDSNISILSNSKYPPLITSTKLVKPNLNEDILETWKKEDKNDKIENGKKLEFNGMDTNYMMNKISQIKNKILENSNISTNKFKNNDKDNKCMINISSISKTNEDKSNQKYNDEIKINNDTNEFEFHIENNEDNIDINKEEGNYNSQNDSVEIISNNNNKYIYDEADLEKKSETLIVDNKNNSEKNSKYKDNINYKEKNERPQEIIIQNKNINKNLNLFNKDNNVSISKQLKKRGIYLNNNEDKQNILLRNNENINNNYIINNNKNWENNKNDNSNDFPHKEANTVQTFNPNNYKIKNKESSLIIKSIKINENNKEEQDMMKKINFFEENSSLNYNKEKLKNKDIIEISLNELNNNNSSNDLNKRNNNDSINLDNQMKESSILNESLNTFAQNLNIKWKDMTKDDINSNNVNKKDDNDNNFLFINNELKKNKMNSFDKENTIDKFDEIRKKY